MSPEKLHRLILSLTKEQKAQFRRFSKSSKTTLDVVLYDRLLKAKQLNKRVLEKVRGTEFKDSSMFYYYRVALAEKIISCLVSMEGGNISALQFIEKAIAEDVQEIGEKALQKEMIAAESEEEFDRLAYLFSFKRKLENAYNVKIEIEKVQITEEDCRAQIDTYKTLDQLQKRIARGFKKKEVEKQQLADESRIQLKAFRGTSQREKDKIQKIKTGLASLIGNYPIAYELQFASVEGFRDRSFKGLSPIQSIDEINLLIRLSLITGKKEAAFRHLQMLDEIQVTHSKEIDYKTREGILTGVYLADHYANAHLMIDMISQMESASDLIPTDQKAFCLYLAGITYLFAGMNDSAVEAVQKMKQISSAQWKGLTWEPELVLALALREAEQINYSESAFRASVRRAKNVETTYPSTALRIARGYLKEKFWKPGNLNHELEKVNALLQSPDEKRSALFFDIRFWMLGKMNSTLPSEYISESGKADQVLFGT